jgi:hypothetical protein
VGVSFSSRDLCRVIDAEGLRRPLLLRKADTVAEQRGDKGSNLGFRVEGQGLEFGATFRWESLVL